MVLHFALYNHQIKLGDFTEVNSDACMSDCSDSAINALDTLNYDVHTTNVQTLL